MNHLHVFALFAKQSCRLAWLCLIFHSNVLVQGGGIIHFQYWIFRLSPTVMFGYLSISVRCTVLTNNCTSNLLYGVKPFLKFTLKYLKSEHQWFLKFSFWVFLTALKLLTCGSSNLGACLSIKCLVNENWRRIMKF